MKMTNQIKHIRHSKFGKQFVAGSRIEIDKEPDQEEENILDNEEIEIPTEDVEEIKEKTGVEDEEILKKVAELGTNDVEEIISALKEE